MFTQNRDIRTERQARPWIKYAAVVGLFALATLLHVALTPYTPFETALGDVLVGLVVASPVLIVMLMLADALQIK